jgi:hypothetical protein
MSDHRGSNTRILSLKRADNVANFVVNVCHFLKCFVVYFSGNIHGSVIQEIVYYFFCLLLPNVVKLKGHYQIEGMNN